MDALPLAERAKLKARQGVPYPVLEGLMVADPETWRPACGRPNRRRGVHARQHRS